MRRVKLAERERPRFSVRLQSLRQRKRFSLRALGEAAELSATYLRTLEQGYDPRTGKLVRPSVDVIRRLARALGDGAEDEAERIFADFMRPAVLLIGRVWASPVQQASVTAPSTPVHRRIHHARARGDA